MPMLQPSGIGRRPANVSAESMLITPDLKPHDLFPIKRYLNYTPPPRGKNFVYCPLKTNTVITEHIF